MDHAICPGLNVGFSNWRSIMRAVERQAGGVDVITETVIEALAVHVFMEDGKMTDTWLLRCDSALAGERASSAFFPRIVSRACFVFHTHAQWHIETLNPCLRAQGCVRLREGDAASCQCH